MSLLKLKSIGKDKFDPIAEVKKQLAQLGVDKIGAEVYVFGSALTDQFSPASDIDVLVVLNNKELVQKAQQLILEGDRTGWPVDWILKERSEFERRSEIGGVCFIAKHHGKKIS